MIPGDAKPLEEQVAAADLAELRDSVNNTRACLRGLHKIARAANALVADLEDRLEQFDTNLQRTSRAPEAKNVHQQTPARIRA